MTDNAALVPLLTKHYELAADLKRIKAEELALRKKIIPMIRENEAPGITNHAIEHFKVRINQGLRYSLDQDYFRNAYYEHELTAEEESCLRVKFELDKRNYDKTFEVLPKIDDNLTVTPSLPSISIEYAE